MNTTTTQINNSAHVNSAQNSAVSAASLAAINAAAVSAAANPVTPLTDSLELSAKLAQLGETLGDFKAYDSQLPIAEIEGSRIIKCLYQTNPKTGKKAQENSYVRVPTKHLTEEHIVSRIADLTPYFLAYLQELENKEIQDNHRKGGLTVYCSGLSLDKIIERLEESSTSSRLSKDKIESWFTDIIEPTLATKFAAKLGLTENSSEADFLKLETVLAAYKGKFSQLANPKAFIQEADCVALIGVINACGAESNLLGSRFISRLTNMSKKSEEVLLTL